MKPAVEVLRQAISVYFDTNVYRFAREKDEVEAIRLILKNFDAQLVVSSGNIFETLAISQSKSRREEAQAIVSLEPRYEDKPESWRHAQELLFEIRRRRPNWVRSVSFRRSIKSFLQGHLQLWEMFKRGDFPSAEAYAQYRRDFEQGVERSSELDKFLRIRMRAGDTFSFGKSSSDATVIELHDPEVFWRFESLMAWHSAVVLRSAASRDYADWIDPYLKNGAFEDASYESFWLHDASGANLPLNRLTSLITFHQLKRKITHGNAVDQIHGSNWLLQDVFFTADRAFYDVLMDVRAHAFGNVLEPILLHRGSSSCAAQIDAALSNISLKLRRP